jgi:hypothetical protein
MRHRQIDPAAREIRTTEVHMTAAEAGAEKTDFAVRKFSEIENHAATFKRYCTEAYRGSRELGTPKCNLTARKHCIIKYDFAAGKSVLSKLYGSPGKPCTTKTYFASRKPGAAKSDFAIRKLRAVENNLSTRKYCVSKSHFRTGEARIPEAHNTASKLCSAEAHKAAAAKLSTKEGGAVKYYIGEIKITAPQGNISMTVKVIPDYADNSMADLTAGLECQLLSLGCLVARVELIGHTQVSAQDVDTCLPILLPVIRESRHSMYSRQSDRGLITAKLSRDGGEPLVEHPAAVVRRRCLGHTLAPVGHHECDESASPCDRREHQLQHSDQVMQ